MRSSLAKVSRSIPRHNSVTRSRQCWLAVGKRWNSNKADDTGHKWSTPLAKTLAEVITTTGPLPVASFMRQCLTSDLGGYYSSSETAEKDQFGAAGDFVTSPEISQIFGELVGVWFVAEWIAQGKRSKGVYLMEAGPGRGTLMDDILRSIRNFKPMMQAVEAVYLIESSPALREKQHRLLCSGHLQEKHELGWQSRSKYEPSLPIIWCEDIRHVPKTGGETPFIIAHEFFDALPIHVFQSVAPAPQNHNEQEDHVLTPTGPIPVPRRSNRAATEHQWRELVVSPRPPHRLKEREPEFELTVARAATPHSMYLPELSARYQALRQTDSATIEISPEAQAYAADFAIRLGGTYPTFAPSKTTRTSSGEHAPSGSASESFVKEEASGAALVIDYGPPDRIPANSLRGIRSHALVSPFHHPGLTDVSADVDFLALAERALDSSPGVEVHGPVDQARFLTAMGIEQRAASLVKRAVDKDRGESTGHPKGELTEIVKRINDGWRRLVDRSPQGMGRLYQVMAILPYKPPVQGQPRRRPVGFGGDVVM